MYFISLPPTRTFLSPSRSFAYHSSLLYHSPFSLLLYAPSSLSDSVPSLSIFSRQKHAWTWEELFLQGTSTRARKHANHRPACERNSLTSSHMQACDWCVSWGLSYIFSHSFTPQQGSPPLHIISSPFDQKWLNFTFCWGSLCSRECATLAGDSSSFYAKFSHALRKFSHA